MASLIMSHRNVVIVGKTGAGKSTVANKLLDEEVFKVATSLDGVSGVIAHGEVTIGQGGKSYRTQVVDTVGLFDQRLQNKDTIAEIKKYFRHIFHGGINLVLFVFRKGRFTAEEQDCLETIISIFRRDISPIAALVVTDCDNMRAANRAKYVDEFRSNPYTSEIAAFMGKGIFPVGFPDTSDMDEDEIPFANRKINADVATLRDLVCSCGEMRLGKQLFEDEWWEKFLMEQKLKDQSKKKICTML